MEKTILIVDDEIYTVEGIKSCLDWKHLGIDRIHTAFNAAQARDILNTEPVDIILCDIEMPQESGLSLLRWVREKNFNTRFIILSCHSNFKYAQEALHLKSFDYLVKPVSASELKQVLLQAIASPEVFSRIKDEAPPPKEREALLFDIDSTAPKDERNIEENLFYEDVKRWTILLQGDAVEKVRSELRNCIARIPLEKRKDKIFLEKILLDFQYVLFSVLNIKGISPHCLLDSEEKIAHYHTASDSISNLLRWIDSALDDMMDILSDVKKSNTYVGRAIEFIEQHLSEDISCGDIADHVGVNSDYLTRLFKKELNISTSGYLIQKRIGFAKDLLVNSKFLIGEIAALCGYDNPAHFSCTFKRFVHDTPINYRNARGSLSVISG